MRRLPPVVQRQLRYLGMALPMAKVGADLPSRLRLAALTAVILVKRRTPWHRRPVRLRVRIGGRTFPVAITERTELEVLREMTLEDEYRLAAELRPATIVDLGAHVGLATLKLLAVAPDARVVAVEADPELVPRLRRNVAGLPVTVVHAAIGAESGTREFFHGRDSWSNAVVRTRPWQTSISVPAVSLHDLLDAHGLGRVDLLKIDVEGAEWEVLRDGVPDAVDAVVGEVHAQGRDPQVLLDVLSRTHDVAVERADDELVVFRARRREPADGTRN